MRRFKREARVCTALDHPNVVRVFLFGQLTDGSLYIVMEFLRGRSLLDVIQREGALPVHRALHVSTQVCDGVGEAHAQGVIHRDLKPENIVLVSKARDPDFVKVLDFGIARVLWGDDQTQATQSGLVFGTARYISPEGAAGEATDARSDVYSLGILTYQLLSGETPFDAASPVAMLMKHIHSSPPHILTQERARHVPEPVADVVMRALSKNPEGRYDDAHAFGDALRVAAERAGFEVRGRAAGRPSIGPPSSPGVTPVPTPEVSARETTQRTRTNPTDPVVRPGTLAAAPSPFGESEEELSIPGLSHKRARSGGSLRLVLGAFVLGVLLVGGGFGVATWLDDDDAPVVNVEALGTQAREALAVDRYDTPRETSVLGLTDRMLRVSPDDPEARRIRRDAADRLAHDAESQADSGEREQALQTYRRALAFVPDDDDIQRAIAALEAPPPPEVHPGVRTLPEAVVDHEEVTLSAVLDPEVEVGARSRPRFLVKRGSRQIGRSIEAHRADDGSYQATHTFTVPASYRVIFRIGTGTDRIELSSDVEVARNPRRHVHHDLDPPPVTTQGSTWTPPTIAPAWTPTPATQQQTVSAPPAQPDPPPPPAPWTGGGSVL